MPWIRLLSIQHFDLDGLQRTYHPGDCVEIGNQRALKLIDQGAAERLDPIRLDLLDGVGVVATANGAKVRQQLGRFQDDVPVRDGHLSAPWPRTLCWDGAARLRMDLIGAGFRLLDTWDVACPLGSLETLAADIGTDRERAQTTAVVRDLRVPFYDPRVVFLRPSAATDQFFAAWNEERKAGGDARLALLRALYVSTPLLLALPPTWIHARG